MRNIKLVVAPVFLSLFSTQIFADDVKTPPSTSTKTLVAGHRGMPALRPEHTLASYQLAIDNGADIIEPDLVPTKDGVLVARHESLIGIVDANNKPVVEGSTTNVAMHPEFADRIKTKQIDGVEYKGWFTEDFTLAELKTLRARERIPSIRPNNASTYNDQFEIPTLQEVINLAKANYKKTGKTIALYPETKHPTYFKSIGLPTDNTLIDTLAKNEYTAKIATVYIQSFEVQNLKNIRARLDAKHEVAFPMVVQLIDYWNATKLAWAQPYDVVAVNGTMSYKDMLTLNGLKDIKKYADVVAPYKEWLIPQVNGVLGQPTNVIDNAHNVGLKVHTWTFRPENNFAPKSFRSNANLTERNESGSIKEIQTYLAAGLDGLFSDDSAVARKAVDTFVK